MEMVKVVDFVGIEEVIGEWSEGKKKMKEVVIGMVIFMCREEKGGIEVLEKLG